MASLLDYSTVPTIDQEMFPATPGVFLWTSTTFVQQPYMAWKVDLTDGLTGLHDKLDARYQMRCARYAAR